MSIIRRYLKPLIALTVILTLFFFSQLPSLSVQERKEIARRFQFTSFALPELGDQLSRKMRTVHPSLERHKGWISAVGASVALNDLDGDGLSNDVCYVDTRSDQVIVSPVPGTGNRYDPLTLKVTELPYDNITTAPMGCLPGDLNEDGVIDILVYYWGRSPVAFFQKEKGIYHQQEISLKGEIWNTNAATFSDLDGDGHTDLIIANYFPDNAEILNPQGTGTEPMQDSMTRAFNGGKSHIFRWVSATTGASASVEYEQIEGIFPEDIDQGWTLAVGTADLDGDLLPEIYFANDFGPDRLLHNRSTPGKLQFALLEGQKGLTTPNSKVLGHDGFKGMGVDFADVNKDGLLDIYVSNIG